MILHLLLKPALLLTLLFSVPIAAIRAQPYTNRVTPTLIPTDCPTPCFMGIRPGVTPMRESAEILDAHEWVANGQADFPKELRDAPFFDAVLRKTTITWRWSSSLPDWIVGDQRGGMTIQDARVLDIGISTRLTLGDILLAFGSPTEAYFFGSKDGQRLEYTLWYAESGIIIIAHGACPFWRAFQFPAQIIFSRISPRFPEGDSRASVCG